MDPKEKISKLWNKKESSSGFESTRENHILMEREETTLKHAWIGFVPKIYLIYFYNNMAHEGFYVIFAGVFKRG